MRHAKLGRALLAGLTVFALGGCAFIQAYNADRNGDPLSSQKPGGLTVIATAVVPDPKKMPADEYVKNQAPNLDDASAKSLGNAIPGQCFAPSKRYSAKLVGIDDVIIGFAITELTNEINTALTSYVNGVQATFTPASQSAVLNMSGLLRNGDPILRCVVIAERKATPAKGKTSSAAQFKSDHEAAAAAAVAAASAAAASAAAAHVSYQKPSAPLGDADLATYWDFVAVVELVASGSDSAPTAYKYVPIYYNLAQSTALTVPPSGSNHPHGQISATIELALTGVTSKGAASINDPKVTLSKLTLGTCSRFEYIIQDPSSSDKDTPSVQACTPSVAGSPTADSAAAAGLVQASSPWFSMPDPKDGGCFGSKNAKCVSFPTTLTVTLTQAGSGAPDFTTAKSEVSTFTGDLNTLLNDYAKK